MLRWLKHSTNQKILALVGSAIAAVIIATWTVYTHFYPNKPTGSDPKIQATSGLAAGADITVGRDVNIGLTAGQVSQLIDQMRNRERQMNEGWVDTLATNLGVTQQAVTTILRRLEEQDVEVNDLPKELISENEYRQDLLARLGTLDHDNPDIGQ